MSEKWKNRLVLVILSIAFLYLLYYLRSITIPIFIAAIFAYLLDPVIDRFEKYRISRSNSILLLTFVAVIVFCLALLLVIPAIEGELREAVKNLPLYAAAFKEKIGPFIDNLLLSLFPGGEYRIETLIKEGEVGLKKVPLDIWKQILTVMTSTFKSTLSLFISIIGALIIPLYLYYILKDFDNIKEGILSLIPVGNRDYLIVKFAEIDETLSAFIRGQLLICLILALIYSVGLSIIGVDLALVIGILSGIAFLIPYVGTIAGIVAASMMAVLEFHDITHVIYVLILYGTAQLLEGTVITPKIIGDKMGLHPLLIIVAIITGGELFGLMGMLLAVPVAAILKILMLSLLENYKESPYFKGSGP